MKEIFVIVPALPPQINGLGDYAAVQARALYKDYGVQTKFIVAGRKKYPSDKFENFEVISIDQDAGEDSYEKIGSFLNESPDVFHLHYVGYGYEKRGAPLSLLNFLKRIKRTEPAAKIITTFHELYAGSNKPWTSAFWLRQMQKKVCRGIYLLSDEVITVRNGYAKLLKKFKNKNVHVMPVFSNTGEEEFPLQLEKRDRTMIIFSSANIDYSFSNFTNEIIAFCRENKVTKITTIGNAEITLTDHSFYIEKNPFLPADEISRLMKKAYCCFIGFPFPEWFAKSGVFATACAHGTLPIAIGSSGNEDGVIGGKNYFDCLQPSDQNSFQQIADEAYRWYMQHQISKNVSLLNEVYSRSAIAN